MINYSETDREELAQALLAHPSLPHVSVSRSTLGGEDKASLLISLSLDPKNLWVNGIYQNSRYRQFHLFDGSLESISGGYNTPKFRKSKIKNPKHAAEKIIAWATQA